LANDTSYDPSAPDDTFEELDKACGQDIEFVIAGHTHLRRAIHRRRANGYYFNSGTWIRLIQLRDEVLDDAEQFARVWAAFSAGSMKALDDLRDLGKTRNQALVEDTSTVVGIHAPTGSATRTWGQLYAAQDDGTLEPVERTRLPAN